MTVPEGENAAGPAFSGENLLSGCDDFCRIGADELVSA
jgi:hypothetical protein